MDILVIDITNRCFLACSNCTRDIVHQKSTREMTPDVFRTALASLRDWWQPGRVIGLIGGEPTLNKHFAEICRIFRDEFHPGPLQHGREPIGDFNAFAHQRLFDRTNGKGLWTSFGPKFNDYYELIMETFSHWNANDHSQGGLHQTSLVDAREMCAALGIPWEHWPHWRDRCWLQNSWSGAITPDGKAYFCERAGQLDQLYNGGRLGWDVAAEPQWWRRTPEQFGEQLSLCEMCSLALPGPGQVDALDRDIIGQAHEQRLLQIGSPAVKGGRYEKFDAARHIQQRRITTKDSYIAPSGIRAATDNAHVRPRHLTAIVTCVGRSQHLEQTLAHNSSLVQRLQVVTHPADRETIELVRSCPTAELVLSDSCFADGHAFNKGRMINAALAQLDKPDWILLTDADVFLPPTLPHFWRTHSLNPGVPYGVARHDSSNPAVAEYFQPNGYFQLFHPRASAIAHRWPAVQSEEFCSAGSVDSWFMQQFPPEKRVRIGELAAVHIAHSSQMGQLWNGPPSGGRWRQFGVLTTDGMQTIEPLPEVAGRKYKVRMVDTLFGLPWEGTLTRDQPLPLELVQSTGDGLLWLGRPIGRHHIHCAYWVE